MKTRYYCLSNIPHIITFPPLHFMLYRGNSIAFGTVQKKLVQFNSFNLKEKSNFTSLYEYLYKINMQDKLQGQTNFNKTIRNKREKIEHTVLQTFLLQITIKRSKKSRLKNLEALSKISCLALKKICKCEQLTGADRLVISPGK